MGLFRGLAIRHVKALMPWAIGGFLINAVTGALFLIMQPHLYLSSAVWWAKVAFIGIAGANALFFETRLAVPALAMDPDADTSTHDEGHRRGVALQLVRGPVLRTHAAVPRHGELIEGIRAVPREDSCERPA